MSSLKKDIERLKSEIDDRLREVSPEEYLEACEDICSHFEIAAEAMRESQAQDDIL